MKLVLLIQNVHSGKPVGWHADTRASCAINILCSGPVCSRFEATLLKKVHDEVWSVVWGCLKGKVLIPAPKGCIWMLGENKLNLKHSLSHAVKLYATIIALVQSSFCSLLQSAFKLQCSTFSLSCSLLCAIHLLPISTSPKPPTYLHYRQHLHSGGVLPFSILLGILYFVKSRSVPSNDLLLLNYFTDLLVCGSVSPAHGWRKGGGRATLHHSNEFQFLGLGPNLGNGATESVPGDTAFCASPGWHVPCSEETKK